MSSTVRIVLVVSLCASGAHATDVYSGRVVAPEGEVAVADYDGDGVLDLAVAGNLQLTVALGRGDGDFEPGTVLLDAEIGPVTSGDFDGDGDPDLAVVTTDALAIAVFLNDGSGVFAGLPPIITALSLTDVIAGDFTDDGITDLAVAVQAPSQVRVYAGNGVGGFTIAQSVTVTLVRGLDAGDIDEDGDLDILAIRTTAGFGSQPAAMLVNDGGTLTGPVEVTTGAAQAGVLADLDADGHLDLVATQADDLRVYLGDGAGTFVTPVVLSGEGPWHELATGDLDGDGALDVVGLGDPHSAVFFGRGDGTVDPPLRGHLGTEPARVTAVDLDDDGSDDLLVRTPVAIGFYSGRTSRARPNGSVSIESPESVAVADVDGDGELDLAVVDSAPGTLTQSIHVLRGTAGSPPFEPLDVIDAANDPRSCTLADLDDDGDPDLIVTNLFNLSVFINDGTGHFGSHVTYPTGGGFGEASVADVDEDGHVDIIVASPDTDSIAFLRGTGLGWFESPIFYATGGEQPEFAALADFDGDGHLDVATTNTVTDSVTVLAGDGAGAFTLATILVTGDATHSIAVGDVDDDGSADLATIGFLGLYFFLGDGSGGFDLVGPIEAGFAPNKVAIADVDLDGNSDVLVVSGFAPDKTPGALFDDGTGGLAPPVSFLAGRYPRGLALADIDGNGAPDLVAPCRNSDEVVVLLNRSVDVIPFRRGDVNADGAVDVADAVASLDALFAGGPPPSCRDAADANDDGSHDIADIVATLGFLFTPGTPPPPPPHPACGDDPTEDALDCVSLPGCP